MRGLCGWILCLAALGLGVATAAQASANRARGDALDRLARWCEAQSRRTDRARAGNQRAEWRLGAALAAEVRPRGPAGASAASGGGVATP
jgi:hypothetical protein